MGLSATKLFVILVATIFVASPFAAHATATSSATITLNPVINLSNSPANSTAPVVRSVGKYVYVAWVEKPTSSHSLVYFDASSDSGATWSAPVAFSGLQGTANQHSSAVQMAAEGSYVFMDWKQGSQTGYAISANNGATFTYGVFSVPSALAGTMTGQAVAACGSYAYFTWADQTPTSHGKPIIFIQAHDTGSGTFSLTTAASISSTTSAFGEDESACVGNYVYVVWDSIYFTASANNGATWSTIQQLKASGGSGGTLSREPMVAAAGTNVYVTYPSDVTGSYQDYIVVSNNNGATFAAPMMISTGMNNSREVQNGAIGNTVYVTARGKMPGVGGTQQYVYVSSNAGGSFTSPILLGKLPNPENGFGGIAIDGGNANVYVAWIHRALKGVSNPQQIFLSGSNDGGSTWTAPVQVSHSVNGTVGYGDPSGGQGPMVAASNGMVYVVWQDNTTGNGDIYFASGSLS